MKRPAKRIIAGMGELHLEVLVDRMLREFRVQARVGRPQVAYRESITLPVEQARIPLCQADRRAWPIWACGSGDGAWRAGQRYCVRKRYCRRGIIPKEYIPAVEKGVREAAEGGILAGYPATDIKIRLYDGSFHEVDSNEMAFKMAGSLAFKEGAHAGWPDFARADDEGGSHCTRRVPG